MNVYVVAHTRDIYMFPASRQVFKTEKAVINEYKKLYERGKHENLSILKAQWVEADFDEYEQLKNSIENEEEVE